MDMFDLAGTLFGNRRDQVAQGSTLTATGSTASADGIAGIVIDADVTPAEGTGDEDVDQTIIDLPTSPDVAEGDEVIVTLVGDGPLKTPIVTANPGSGDRMAAAVTEAHDLAASVESIAQEAKEVAEATGQHFWPDSDGAHVTQVTKDEWNDSTSPNYHSGPNSLWNSLGMLFRDGLNNLMAILTNGIAIYDGNGNDAEHILAEFAADHVRIGGTIEDTGQQTATVQFFGGDVDTEVTSIDARQSVMQSAVTGNVDTVTRDVEFGSIVTDSRLWNVEDRAVNGHLSFSQSISDYDTSSYETSLTSLYASTTGYNYAALTVNAQNNKLDTSTTETYSEIAARANRIRLEHVGGDATFTMANVILALTNAAKSNTWVSVSASNWATMNSGYSITASDLKYNAYQHRIIGSLTVRETTGHSAGNNVCGTVKSAYRPPARQIIHTTTNSAYKMFVDSGGGLTLVLGSATSGTTDHWFALDYIVDE